MRETILNEPADGGDILIPILNDTVAIGGEYLVLLNDAAKTAPIYTLVAKDSIYALDAAKEIPELAEVLSSAKDYVIPVASLQ